MIKEIQDDNGMTLYQCPGCGCRYYFKEKAEVCIQKHKLGSNKEQNNN